MAPRGAGRQRDGRLWVGEGGTGRGEQCWGESCRQGRAEGEKGSQALTAVCVPGPLAQLPARCSARLAQLLPSG